ncbi:hypothetical protein BLA29_009712 [Euroglyphus maynei]|uniref:Uncharacterized protein n=1 Tax=Euroglyphus maynei TaxID=6958 RepID=A0A1Y3ANL0_EURMA|nr:hypothetical protein BLA29_009712 [Euroglyphus maynei]
MNSNYGANQQQLTNVSKGKNNSYERRLKSPVIKIASDYGREIDLKNFDAGTYDRDKAYEYLFTMMNDGHDDRTRRPPIGRENTLLINKSDEFPKGCLILVVLDAWKCPRQ